MAMLTFPEDPFDAWDEHAFQEWQSCRYSESTWLRAMFAAMDEDEIKTVTGFEMIDQIDDIRDGIYRVQAEPTLPKRAFFPKRHDTNPRSPRDTMRARRGR